MFFILTLAFLFLYVAYTDNSKRIIPNWVSLAFILAYVFKAFLYPQDISTAGSIGIPWTSVEIPVWPYVKDILAALAVFIVGYILWCFNLWGAGDVKFLTAASLFFGVQNTEFATLSFLLLTGVLGGLLSFIFLACKFIVLRAPLLGKYLPAGKPIPYGVAISGSGLYGLYCLSTGSWGIF